jgi:hypothetical protein
MFFPMKKAAKVKENIHAKVRFYRCSCLQIIVFDLRVAGQSPSLLWQILFSRTWRQLSLDGRGTPVKSVINALPLLLLQFPLFLLKLQLIQTGQQFFLCSPNLSIHICTPPLKHFLICCKCTQKASPILLLTTVHATSIL